MMEHFRIQYIPGGMGLTHSAWWLTECRVEHGVLVQTPIKFLRRADYKWRKN